MQAKGIHELHHYLLPVPYFTMYYEEAPMAIKLAECITAGKSNPEKQNTKQNKVRCSHPSSSPFPPKKRRRL